MNTPMEDLGSSVFAIETELGVLGRKIGKVAQGNTEESRYLAQAIDSYNHLLANVELLKNKVIQYKNQGL